MSYDIRLVNRKTAAPVMINVRGIQQYGGTIAFNPETGRICDVEEVRFNITYNYSRILCRPDVLGEEGIRSLYGERFETILDRLYRARDAVLIGFADSLDVDLRTGEKVEGFDYWKTTPDNVIRTLEHMILVLNVVRTQYRDCSDYTLDGD